MTIDLRPFLLTVILVLLSPTKAFAQVFEWAANAHNVQLLRGHGYTLGDTLWLGLEYSYWHHKFGVDGVVESVPQLQMKRAF